MRVFTVPQLPIQVLDLYKELVEAAGIEICVAPMETQQFQLFRSTAGGVRVECSDERMQQYEGVHPSLDLVAWAA
jgi:hypothetical protein